MNADIRLSVGFPNHPKTIKLERRLGFQGIRSLLALWTWAAQNRPDGNLGGANGRSTVVQRPLDEEDIEIAAQWPGEPGLFVATLVALGWLDRTESGYLLHEWQQHNPWVAAAADRGDKARFSRMAKTHPEIYKSLSEKGIRAVSAEEFQRLKAGGSLQDRSTGVEAAFDVRSTTVIRSFNDRATPSPSPFPSPSPNDSKERVPGSERDDGDKSADETHRRAAFTDLGIALSAMEKPIEGGGEESDGSRGAGAPANVGAASAMAELVQDPPQAASPVPGELGVGAPHAFGLPPDEPATGQAEAPAASRPRRRPVGVMPAAPEWLPQAVWDRWQAHRRALKKPLSPDGALLSLARLEKAKGFGHDPVELLETAIASGWQGCVFADKHYQPPSRALAVPREGGRRPLRAGPADPAAYLETGGFAVELELEEG